MTQYNAPYEIHVHGDVALRPEVVFSQVQEALKPLWQYAGARSLSGAAKGVYEDEPGISVDCTAHTLQICWTTHGDENFRHVMQEACMSLNEIAAAGAHLEVSFYDTEYEDDEDGSEQDDDQSQARDDFMVCFVGPTPEAIMQVQRNLLVQDVLHIMERHFDASELSPVVESIDKLFAERLQSLASSMQLGYPPRGYGGTASQGGSCKPRHLH